MRNISKAFCFSALSVSSTLPSSFTTAQEFKETFALEELVVTAQKRVETMQDIPASFSVYSAENLEKTNWSNVSDMGDLIPSVEVVGVTKTRTTVFIRAIGTNKYDIGTEGSIGVFVDGVYIPRFSSLMQNLIDLERVEVLRGPQGTLYGRNTIGGAISLYSRRPEQEFEGKVNVGIANEDSFHTSVTVSGALNEQWLGYLGFTRRDTGGFRTDTNSGEQDDEHVFAGRGKLYFNPTDELEISLTGEYIDQEEDAFLGEPHSPSNQEIFRLRTVTVLGAPPAATASEIAAAWATEAQDFYSGPVTDPGFTEVESLSLSLNVNWANDDLVIDSITGYREEQVNEVADGERHIWDVIREVTDQHSETYSQEIKISSEEGGRFSMDDNLEWLAGVFLYQDKASRGDRLELGVDGNLAFLAGGPPFGANLPGPWPVIFTVDLETTSWAVFSQATYQFTDELSATLGIRYSKDTKDFTYTSVLEPVNHPFFATNQFSFDDKLKFESTDPKIVVEYEPAWAPDFMAYISASQGYKSGGIQFVATVEESARESFDKETLKAYEIGFKSRWMDHRLQVNGAMYHYDYEDQQVQARIIVPSATTPQIITDNVGSSEMDGFEIDTQYLFSENLLLQFSYSYLNSKFVEFLRGDGVDLTGTVLPASPEHSFWLSGEYTKDIGEWEGGVRVDYSWRDDQFFTPEHVYLQDNYGLANVNLTLRSPSEKLFFRLWCRNCNDERYATSYLPYNENTGWLATGDRRRYGLDVQYTF